MAGKFKDLAGKRFGRLVVGGRYVDVNRKSAFWHIVCDCGTEKIMRGSQLTSGGAVSCGCYRKDNPPAKTHGMTNSFEFSAWTSMRKRCSYTKHKAYPQYGGRGIKVCARWQLFSNFYEDMGPCPYLKGSIERLNVDGDYEPDNCIWLPRTLQSANRRVVLKSRERQSMMRKEIEGLYELVGSLYVQLSGIKEHRDECAINNAPTNLPGPCNCWGATNANEK
jgi:hypothetical protein